MVIAKNTSGTLDTTVTYDGDTTFINVVVTDITITKIWSDYSNADNTRPDSIIVNLLANGEVIQSVNLTYDYVTNDSNVWTYTFTYLPVYEDGEEIEYTISEDAVENYTSVINGFSITNTYITSMSVSDSETRVDNDDASGTSVTTETDSKTKIGDPSQLARYFTMMISALGVLGVGAAYRRRKQGAQK